MRAIGMLGVMAGVIVGLMGAAAPTASAEQVVLDPLVVLSELRDAYATRATADEVRVKVESAGQHQGDTIAVRIVPPNRVRLSLGGAEVLVDEQGLRATRVGNRVAYFEAPLEEGGALATLRKRLPPLVAPQLVLALGSLSEPMTPWLEGVRWTSAAMRPAGAGRSAMIVLTGVGPRAEVRVEIDPDTSRLRTMKTKIDDGTTIVLECEALSAPSAASMALDVDGRRKVDSLAELDATSVDTSVGDPLPSMTLQVSGQREAVANLAGPGVVLFVSEAEDLVLVERVTAARRQLIDAGGAGGAVSALGAWSVLVMNELHPDPALAASRVPRIDGVQNCWTTDRRATVGRFDARATVLLVVFDGQMTVRAVQPLARETEAAELAAMIERGLVTR
jgi:hypothetical protein